MRKLLRFFFFLFYKPYAIWQISAPRTYRYRQLKLSIPVGVFHPSLFFSTHFLADELLKLDLKNKLFLELGSGSGFISLSAARAGATVTAVDINPLAVETTAGNAVANGIKIEVLQSDLFSALGSRRFDVIAINPPYFKKTPKSDADKAWFAGKDYDYFTKLFAQIPNHLHADSIVYLVTSEDVDMEHIQQIAAASNFALQLKATRVICFELNYIYALMPLVK